MCAGALTAVTTGAGEIALGAADVVVAGGVEHMGHHPMGAEVDFNPRYVAERLVDTSAVTWADGGEPPRPLPGADGRDADDSRCARSSGRPPPGPNGVTTETVVPMGSSRTRAGRSPTATSSSAPTRRSTGSPACRRRSAQAAA